LSAIWFSLGAASHSGCNGKAEREDSRCVKWRYNEQQQCKEDGEDGKQWIAQPLLQATKASFQVLSHSRHFCAGFMLTLEAGDVPMSARKPLVFPPESHIHLTDY
jgi:hypothetical protein